MGDSSGRVANLLCRHVANPFRILELAVDASPAAVERKGELLLSMLTVGMADASRYPTPLGARERTPEMVREALSELRDPDRRLFHEWWIRNEDR